MLQALKDFVRPPENSRSFQFVDSNVVEMSFGSENTPKNSKIVPFKHHAGQCLRIPHAHRSTIEHRSIPALVGKRLLDLFITIPALILLSPLFLVVAVIIKCTSKGPILFKQKRVGIGGKIFWMYKFRSMVVDAEELLDALKDQNEKDGPIFKIKEDPRITKVGKFIRKYSIDELPQLINVLRNEMSIVGPRPALPKETVQYAPADYKRLSVLPGLTCIWQVSGRSKLTFSEWMDLDRKYIRDWSLNLDIKLIFATFREVLFPKGTAS